MGALAAPAVEPTSLQTERRSFIAKQSNGPSSVGIRHARLHRGAHGREPARVYILFHDPPLRQAPTPPWYATLPLGWLLATGGLIAVFLAFHIAQLTIGATHPAFVADDPYQNLVVALGFWPVSVAYAGAAVAVGAHVLPGLWTGMRSLGLIHPGTDSLAGALSTVIPLVVVVGMGAVPVALLIGALR
jgi:hypothetical protein